MTACIGIDYKKGLISIGIVSGEYTHAINLTYIHDIEGKLDLIERLSHLLIVLDPEIIAIEMPLFSGFGKSARVMTEISQVIELACGRAIKDGNLAIEVIYVMPAQWKKKILGSGKADKQAAMDFTGFDDHNMAEAVCMAKWAEFYVKENRANEELEMVL